MHPSLGVYFWYTGHMVHRNGLRYVRHASDVSRVTDDRSKASSYLHSLGLSKAAACLVLLAAPVSGLVVQPLAGAFADRTTSRYRRRKPFTLIGSLTCAISILVLSWARELSEWSESRREIVFSCGELVS